MDRTQRIRLAMGAGVAAVAAITVVAHLRPAAEPAPDLVTLRGDVLDAPPVDLGSLSSSAAAAHLLARHERIRVAFDDEPGHGSGSDRATIAAS